MTPDVAFTDPPRFAAFQHVDAREGFEVAFFRAAGDAIVVEGETSAVEQGEPFAVDYIIELDRQWRTRRATVRGRSLSGRRETRIEADGAGSWTVDGRPVAGVDGCLDLDLESSSVTNAFPVRRLALAVGQRSEAPAAYVRAFDLRIERLEQQYERVEDAPNGHARFRYAAPALDFRTELEYDASGLVVTYPGIAVRRA